MYLMQRHFLLLELATVFMLSSLSNGQTVDHSTPHTFTPRLASDTGGEWDGDPPDPSTDGLLTSHPNSIGLVPATSFETTESGATSSRTEGPLSSPPLTVGGQAREGFFQSQAIVELPHTLPIRGYTSISFRTCSYGTILKQTGWESDFVQLDLSEGGILNFTLSRLGRSHSTVIGGRNLSDNEWHRIFLKYELGRLILGVDNATAEVANVSGEFSDFLKVNLSSADPRLVVGGSFEGCILEGSNMQISSSEARYAYVDWHSCPLPVGRNCSGFGSDPCFPQPCRNRGTCVSTGDSFTCECYSRYEGLTCELDQGSLCDPDRTENLCQNGGVCREDFLGNSTFCICPDDFTGDKCQEVSVCNQNPCENNGTCSLSESGLQCSCPYGVTGLSCEHYTGYCSLKPCLHGGLCSDMANSFDCDCRNTGYQGDLCEVNINECLEDYRCAIGATCFDLYGSYECACPQGFGGPVCDTDLDECSSGPCLNEGICRDGLNSFSCVCPSGFEGFTCETNIDDCYDVFCPNNSVCVDYTDDYKCECKPGYAGDYRNCFKIDGCDSSPCLNNGSCFSEGQGNFFCICPVGFTGETCDVNEDDCHNVYCENGGTCEDGSNNYTCLCAPGYSGPNCQEIIDECQLNVCGVHAILCTSLPGDFRCDCEEGWTGKNCDIELDHCSSSPCDNNATCINNLSTFSCSCPPGYEGILCDLNIDDCLSEPCFNGGNCTDEVANFTCLCSEAFMGLQCQDPFDACVTQPCSNGATCTTLDGNRHCQCLTGFEGEDCSVNIDDCIMVTCELGKICFDLVDAITCLCPSGFEGHMCLEEIDECLVDPCQNGATCIDSVANFTCQCTPGFDGITCEKDIDECTLETRCNNGVCINNEGSYNCYCTPGYTGTYCTLDINECLSGPCDNGGTCLDQINKYECQCQPGFAGMECQIDIDECASQPCQNNATCIDGINSFICECIPGFTDFVCSTNIDECESSPCQNNGSCVDGINMYDCDCFDTGFKGTHCENNIDDCEFSPCEHDANCTDLIKDYNCSCYDGYTGKNCEEDIMECASDPCQNEGSCYEFSNRVFYENGIFDNLNFSYSTAGGFHCECQPGFAGENCEININECESSPCQYGVCLDGINRYECQCHPGYEGVHCETEIDECQRFNPCIHGTCVDKIADYDCTCEDLYGGKNCSVQLLGCINVECQSGGTCVPMLFNEQMHEFRCDCVFGFTGRNCEHSTTLSMDGDSYLRYESDVDVMASYELLLSFRTTLANVFLAIGENADKYFTLVLHQGRIKLKSSLLNRYDGIYSGSDLNNGEWHRLRLAVNVSHAILSTNNESSEHALSIPSTNVSFPTTYLGGVLPNLKIFADEPFYTGCLRDVRIDDRDLYPSLFDGSSENGNYYSETRVITGCPREAQCQPNPCNNAGQCLDLWSSFQCLCKRPYLGDTCSMSFTPATFGNENFRDSLATIDIPEELRPSYRDRVNVSMVIRTRQQSGIIFYLGSSLEFGNNLVEPGLSFIIAELWNGGVRVRMRLQGQDQTFSVSQPRVDDGDSHLLHVKRDGPQLFILIDNQLELNETVIESGDLDAEILYLGGIPDVENGVGRVRRQLGITHSPRNDDNNFKGVIQDVRLSSGTDTKYVQLFPLDIDLTENFDMSILDDQINATTLTNVLNGTVSDDTCSPNPCLRDGQCSITFNDFECDCPTGFKGKICDELEYCSMYRCPEGATCQNLIDGYECLNNATFNGKNSSLIYESQGIGSQPTLFTFSLKYRSKLGGILMSAGAQEGSLWVGIGKGAVVIQQTNQSTQSTLKTHFRSPSLLDGDWHFLWIGFHPEGLRVSLDNVTLINSDMDDGVIVDFDHIIKSSGIQVGSLPEGINLRSGVPLEDNNLVTVDGDYSSPPIDQYFRGCLDDVRVQSILLPFYAPHELLNDTTQNKFVRKEELGTSLGCKVCFNYECQNEGFCSDPSDTYTCSCPAGFEGPLCQININECIENNCTNGATCIDGINSYTCDCLDGYEGIFCESDIDECASNPCQNGGTCEDHVAKFTCECLEDFIGATCNELKVKNCSNNQCQNGGICQNIFNDDGFADNYMCECPFSYEGINCELVIDFCTVNMISCQKGSCILTHSDEGWMCECDPGYEGEFCGQETDECASGPCENDGKCVDKHLGYDCQCPRGWMGERCQLDVDECKDIRNLCNHGDCINLNGTYACDCKQSHCGLHCFLHNPCLKNPPNCTHGECKPNCDEPSNMTVASCSCFEGWDGEFCTDAVHALSAEALSIIIGVVVGLMLIVAVVGLIVFFMMAKKKRETSGTYSPSKQEYINPRVEMGNLMKPPPEERLI